MQNFNSGKLKKKQKSDPLKQKQPEIHHTFAWYIKCLEGQKECSGSEFQRTHVQYLPVLDIGFHAWGKVLFHASKRRIKGLGDPGLQHALSRR